MSTCPPPFSAEWIKQQWVAVEDQERRDHAGICSLPYGHEGGHWWDEKPAPADLLVRQWQDEAARLDAEAARVRAAGEGGRYQIHGWETRAAALRDCAVELWQALTEDL